MQNQQPPRRRRPMTPEERAMAAERRRQKEILRRRAMRRYYAFLALLGALALAAPVGLFFLIKAAAGWARGGQASSVSAAQSVSASAPPASSGEPAADPNAPADPALWSLILTNTTNPLPEGYAPELASVGSNSRNGEQFMDARVKEPLEQMFAAAKADGIELVARSAYRSTQEQTTLFNSMKQDYINQGMSEEEAFAATKQWRNEPGTSEHETAWPWTSWARRTSTPPRGEPGGARLGRVAQGARPGIRLHPPLYERQNRYHGNLLRTVALPLCGRGGRAEDHGPGRVPGGVSGPDGMTQTGGRARGTLHRRNGGYLNKKDVSNGTHYPCAGRAHQRASGGKNSTAAAFPSTSSGPPPGSGPRPRPCCRWCWSRAIRAARI